MNLGRGSFGSVYLVRFKNEKLKLGSEEFVALKIYEKVKNKRL